MERKYNDNLSASTAASNSALVELWAVVDLKRNRYTTGGPAKQRHMHDIGLRC